MPMLNVTFLTEDPLLADEFDVRRRLSVVSPAGLELGTQDTLYRCQVGVVTQQDPSDLMRAEDGTSVPRRIFIASRFQFFAAVLGGRGLPSYLADEITWNGTVYTVESCLPYSRFGEGLYECIAEHRSPVPPAQ